MILWITNAIYIYLLSIIILVRVLKLFGNFPSKIDTGIWKAQGVPQLNDVHHLHAGKRIDGVSPSVFPCGSATRYRSEMEMQVS